MSIFNNATAIRELAAKLDQAEDNANHEAQEALLAEIQGLLGVLEAPVMAALEGTDYVGHLILELLDAEPELVELEDLPAGLQAEGAGAWGLYAEETGRWVYPLASGTAAMVLDPLW